jgi:hypothetical protein
MSKLPVVLYPTPPTRSPREWKRPLYYIVFFTLYFNYEEGWVWLVFGILYYRWVLNLFIDFFAMIINCILDGAELLFTWVRPLVLLKRT